jgi:hypothetical protein
MVSYLLWLSTGLAADFRAGPSIALVAVLLLLKCFGGALAEAVLTESMAGAAVRCSVVAAPVTGGARVERDQGRRRLGRCRHSRRELELVPKQPSACDVVHRAAAERMPAASSNSGGASGDELGKEGAESRRRRWKGDGSNVSCTRVVTGRVSLT